MTMIQNNTRRFFLGTAVATGIAVATLTLISQMTAQAQEPGQDVPARQPKRSEAALKIGTYDPETAFQSHPAQKKLMGARKTALEQMQQAKQQKNAEKVRQVQQQYEQARDQAVQQFDRDVTQALPKVARDAGIKVVAREVVYKADNVKTVDITPHLSRVFTQKINRPDTDGSKRPSFPQVPQKR